SVKLTTENHFIPNQGTVKAVVQHDPAWTEVFSGESLTLKCDVEDEGSSEWKYTLSNVSVSDSGDYSCRATRGTYQRTMWSQVIRLQVLSESNVFSGESLTLRCEVEDEGGSEWSYDWRKIGVIKSTTTTREYTLANVSVSDSGHYSCRATRGTYQRTMWSQKTRLQVLSESNVLSIKCLFFLYRPSSIEEL
uniref:Ig-like domain-containing protein n=1 Tax=Neogobius melanostomus TaxID=47308 RepID=A0A8C6UWS6_9GOBI